MRAHFLGRPDLAAASRHPFPILKPGPDGQPRRKRAAVREGAKTMVMSWFPSWKGEPRMMPLRHYHHVDMATLLEADASVLRWTSRLEDLPERQVVGIELPHVHFVAHGHRHPRAIRVLRPRTSRASFDEVQAAEGYAALGYRFEVHAADDLKTDAKVRTARALLHQRRRGYSERGTKPPPVGGGAGGRGGGGGGFGGAAPARGGTVALRHKRTSPVTFLFENFPFSFL